jgi:hypothetical protein
MQEEDDTADGNMTDFDDEIDIDNIYVILLFEIKRGRRG